MACTHFATTVFTWLEGGNSSKRGQNHQISTRDLRQFYCLYEFIPHNWCHRAMIEKTIYKFRIAATHNVDARWFEHGVVFWARFGLMKFWDREFGVTAELFYFSISKGTSKMAFQFIDVWSNGTQTPNSLLLRNILGNNSLSEAFEMIVIQKESFSSFAN